MTGEDTVREGRALQAGGPHGQRFRSASSAVPAASLSARGHSTRVVGREGAGEADGGSGGALPFGLHPSPGRSTLQSGLPSRTIGLSNRRVEASLVRQRRGKDCWGDGEQGLGSLHD